MYVCYCISVLLFFFFKQKTAYEMRISDWSSDVCSSDLPMLLLPEQPVSTPRAGVAQWLGILADGLARTPNGSAKLPLLFARAAYWLNDEDWAVRTTLVEALDRNGQREEAKIGRASCRERVC